MLANFNLPMLQQILVICYPSRLYGTLQSFSTVVSFSIGLLNYILNPLAQNYFNGDYAPTIIFLVFPTIILYWYQHCIRESLDEEESKIPEEEPITPLP